MTTQETTVNEKVAAATEQGTAATAQKPAAAKKAEPKPSAPKTNKTSKTSPAKNVERKAKGKKPAKAAKRTPRKRSQNKGAKILDLIRRPKGATLAELMKVSSWQAHSVRGFISTCSRKHDLTIQSEKNESGERVYSLGR